MMIPYHPIVTQVVFDDPSSRYPPTAHSRKRIYTTDSYQNPAKTYYTPNETRITLSPVLGSSSPPMTPHSTRRARSDALIRSSPEIASDTLFHSVREHIEDSSSAWGPRYLSNRYPECAYTPLKHDYHNYPPSSDFDLSEYSEDIDHDIPEADSEHTSDSAPGRNSASFSDTEEEENHGNDDYSFGHSGYRTIFFRTSAERGQWKSHPIPFKSTPLPQARGSVSITSKLPTPVQMDSMRTISEPAPSTMTGLGFSTDQSDDLHHVDGPLSISFLPESDLRPEAESPRTMPSLTSDWDSIPDIDVDGLGYERPSSLPPSSPMSYSVSILSRSISPVSSPVIRPSSPLSEMFSLDQEEKHVDEVEDVYTDQPDIGDKIRSSSSVPTFVLDADVKSENTLDTSSITPSLKSDSAPLSVDPADFQVLESLSSSSATAAQNPDHEPKCSLSVTDGVDITSGATDVAAPDSPMVTHPTDSMKNRSYLSDITHSEEYKSEQEVQEHFPTMQMNVEDDSDKKHAVRKKRRKENDDDEPTLKKRKIADLLRPMTHNPVQNEKTGTRAERDKKNPEQQISAKRRRKGEVSVSASCPASSTKRCKPHQSSLPKASSAHSHVTSVEGDNDRHQPVPLSTQDPETAALNAEICGMLIETMALSRASSLPLSSLYKMVMQTQPSLRSQRSEQEWLTMFAQVLQEGEVGKGSGVFGKVESSGKDNSNRPLEAQWFYVPEQDEDQERAALIRSMMPRPAKRTETKKYKQYYWRPLDKISKWDPEDEL